jgi:hypothetical protein
MSGRAARPSNPLNVWFVGEPINIPNDAQHQVFFDYTSGRLAVRGHRPDEAVQLDRLDLQVGSRVWRTSTAMARST